VLTLSLIANGQTYRGSVLDTVLSKEGVEFKVEFPLQLPILPICGEFDSALISPDPPSVAEDRARLVYQERSARSIRCGLMYRLETSKHILSILNGRRAIRVHPSSNSPVIATVSEDIPVIVHDISTSGIALLVSNAEQDRVSSWAVSVRVLIPNQKIRFEMLGHVKIRRLSGAAILNGVQFDDQTPAFAEKQEIIRQYVMERQQELLQVRANRR